MDKLEQIRSIVQEWTDKQGHSRCWYYPDLFNRLAEVLEIQPGPRNLPPKEAFELGCKQFQDEQYKSL